ncbi:MAG: hypothetical protein BSR46_07305 [Candidatus Dactylopiibacterium carminicum]|uniref:aldose 1-epimerase n=1 Tax=Candidatus Dactylopiibacterium carminicum TaxID=857335 RepID=UPI000BD498B5|nr:aldose 1-epimerase [Candidatus Dactylopiibacterium carminicum]PAS99564.1 MAG: hypothetical protein BSR46_07305 [Candidatus Dactylopiibacterium carminicum]
MVANFPLLPWSNRLTGGGFHLDGRFHAVPSNRDDSPYPMHGTGWMHEWEVLSHEATEIVLGVEAEHPLGYPWHYRARQTYRLEDDGMCMRLEITHLGEDRLPYGLGFHPYIMRPAREEDLRVRYGASGYWECIERGIPSTHHAELPADWDFRQLRTLGQGLIDHQFTGCDAPMRMERRDLGIAIDWLTAEPEGLDLVIVYRPEHGDWWCYEPVTHLTDAFNREGMPGLRLLEKGQSMALEVQQTISSLMP